MATPALTATALGEVFNRPVMDGEDYSNVLQRSARRHGLIIYALLYIPNLNTQAALRLARQSLGLTLWNGPIPPYHISSS